MKPIQPVRGTADLMPRQKSQMNFVVERGVESILDAMKQYLVRFVCDIQGNEWQDLAAIEEAVHVRYGLRLYCEEY